MGTPKLSIEGVDRVLTHVDAIWKRHKDVVKVTGENFNVFAILGLETREVRLHSAFIADLLDPSGCHELGDKFLNEFLKLLADRWSREVSFDSANVKNVSVEYWLGPKNDKGGGFIDIILLDRDGRRIIIENKIYAEDQERQLFRYHSLDPSAPVIYLTLDGSQPTDESTIKHEGLMKQLVLLSYQSDIVDWLEACKRHAVNHPLVRETITQYVNLIKRLTNQSPNQKMQEEIVDFIISDQARLWAALEIGGNYGRIRESIVKDLIGQLRRLAAGSVLSIKNDTLNLSKGSCLAFTSDFLAAHNLLIAYYAEQGDLNDVDYGFLVEDQNRPAADSVQRLSSFVKVRMPDAKSNPVWPAWWDMDWWDNQTFCRVRDGSFAPEIYDRVQELHRLAEEALSS